jgi:hypothetical protein
MAQHADLPAPQPCRPAPDPATAPGLTAGPLVVSTANPRYFTVASATRGGAANGG